MGTIATKIGWTVFFGKASLPHLCPHVERERENDLGEEGDYFSAPCSAAHESKKSVDRCLHELSRCRFNLYALVLVWEEGRRGVHRQTKICGDTWRLRNMLKKEREQTGKLPI